MFLSRVSFLCVLLVLSTVIVAAQQNVRITLADGYSFEVDEVWKQGDEIWYRKGGISKRLEGTVKSLTPLKKEDSAPAKTAPVTTTAPTASPSAPAEAAPLAIWIYLDGGARMRVDEVTESADGAWFRRGNVQKFLERDHFIRIEREQPVVASGAFLERKWLDLRK